MRLRFATRPSKLARWQTNHVIQLLQSAWDELVCTEVVISTQGDCVIDKPLPEIGGKGLFTHELEQALLRKKVDAAVHSLKDLPTEDVPGLVVGVIPRRADARDVLICPAGLAIDDLPQGAVVGTSSTRRRAQLLAYRPDLRVNSIRGNVDTRLRKVREGQYDAIVLASAGVTRLGMQEYITEYFPIDIMLPAPGQGALAVQCRADDTKTLQLLNALDHPPSRMAVSAERSFLAGMGGGCSLPVGALAKVQREEIDMQVVVAAPGGEQVIRLSGTDRDPYVLGKDLAQKALIQGAAEVLR